MSETPEVAGSLAESFPPELAATLNRLADAYSIPRESMTPITISLIAAFSPTAYTAGIGGQVQPLVFHVKDVGVSGINKTGATKLVKYTFQKVRSALINLAGNPTTCFENGVRVNRRLVPDPDNTSSLPALVQKSVSCPNLFGNHDEHGGFTRQVTTGTPNPESGLQFHLETYNGPEYNINELKNKTETTYLPRYNFLTSVQPHLVQKEYAPGTAYFGLGVASRSLWFELHPNFDEDRVRPPLNEDRQTLVEFVCAAAARFCITNGQCQLSSNPQRPKTKTVVLPVRTQQRTADEDEESRGTDISNQENEGRAVSNSSCAAASASTRNGGLQSKAVHGRDAAQEDGNKAPGHNAGRRSETVLATTSHSGPVGHKAGRRSETVPATTSHTGPVSTQRRTYEESQASSSTDDVGDLGDMDDDDCDDNDESDQKQKRQKDGFK